jgi:hypothetical protein
MYGNAIDSSEMVIIIPSCNLAKVSVSLMNAGSNTYAKPLLEN